MSYSPSYQEGPMQAMVTRGLAIGYGAGQVNKYFVRTGGSDNNDGLTELTAFATLAYALTKIPKIYTNEGYFIDITGINESLNNVPFPTVLGSPGFIGIEPSALISGLIFSQLCIHSDLEVFQTVVAADILSINSDIDTGQQTIVTSGGLLVNSLVGKQVRQGTDLFGVVKSNTATDILTTAISLVGGVDTDFCDPGATINDVYIENNISKIQIEGITIDSAGLSSGILYLSNSGDILINNCNICTFATVKSTGFFELFNCYILPATGGNVSNTTSGIFSVNGSFFDGVTFDSSLNGWGYGAGHTFRTSAFEGCGPIWNSGNGIIRQVSGFGFCSQCEFNNSPDEAVYIYGSGAFNIESTKINNAGGDAIRIAGPAILDLRVIPVGAGNAGVGCKIESGAQVNAIVNVNISGAGGEVQVGTQAPQTWASVTGSPNNRVTDSGVNGDNSSALRP